jgi:hypothetical protein
MLSPVACADCGRATCEEAGIAPMAKIVVPSAAVITPVKNS